MVTKIHVQAEKLKADGYKIVVIGDPNHPEVKGTLSHVPGAWCIQSPADVEKLPRSSRVGVVVQSTWSGEGFTEIVRALSAKYYEVRAVNTICTDTHNRQSEALRLAHDVEVMIVVGGKTSANTKHLADLSESRGARAYHIEGPDELRVAVVRRRRSCRLNVRRVDAGMARRRGRGTHGGAGRFCLIWPSVSRAPSRNGLPDIGDRKRSPICFCATSAMPRTVRHAAASGCARRW